MVDIKTQRRNNKAKGNQVFILERYPEEEACNGTYAFGKKKQGGGTNNALISTSNLNRSKQGMNTAFLVRDNIYCASTGNLRAL